MKHSKRYNQAAAKVDRHKEYGIDEALDLIKGLDQAKFDESVELSLSLSIDPKQSDQAVRGTISLPNGTGKTLKVIVFAEGDQAEAARAAGAEAVGGEDLVEKVNGGWLDFDIAVSTPPMMQHVRKLGRVLGPKGMMPSPKSGTVTDDVATAVDEFKQGKIEYRNDSTGNIHVPLGKMSFSKEALAENVEAFMEQMKRSRPVSAKGRFIRKACLSSTMGPGIKLAI